MNAASPGVISLFLQNAHYPTRDAYLAALADAMKEEYEPSSPPASTCSSTAPTSPLAPHAVYRSERR
jgi:5-methyltetrahydropteroyltriglutamate--homocysteine methyltransferase